MAEMMILDILEAKFVVTAQPWWATILKNINNHLNIDHFCQHRPLFIRANFEPDPYFISLPVSTRDICNYSFAKVNRKSFAFFPYH